MECSDAIDRLIEHFLTRKAADPAVPEEIVAHIAGCRACIAELDSISSALTGEPSALKEKADRLLTHRQTFDMMQQEEAGTLGEPPSYMTFEAWFRGQRVALLWQQLTQNLRRLVADIPILIGETAASFGQLPPPLAPRLVPAGVYRQREPIPGSEEEEGEFIELLEIPHRDDNLVIRLRLGPVFDGKGTLVLEVSTLEPARPIEQARVILRDEAGRLLEGMPTDEDGLAFFRELDLGKYIVQVEHAGQTWEFGVTLKSV